MNTHMLSLAVVPVLIWLAVFLYTLMVDRKLARLEARHQEDDL